MIRNIVSIDHDLCIGCGLCAQACHEGAIQVIDGVATLLRDDYCDGLGNCLPECPVDAINIIQREAAAYDKSVAPKRVAKKQQKRNKQERNTNMKEHEQDTLACGCPSTESKTIERTPEPEETLACGCPSTHSQSIDREDDCSSGDKTHSHTHHKTPSQLGQWPVQIKLVPTNAPYLDGANLLIAADCTAFAYGNFHDEFIKNHITLIGCPKLDDGNYAAKLTEIIKNNDIKSVKVARMEVPCCSGIEQSTIQALKDSDKMIPWQVVTVSTDGRILD